MAVPALGSPLTTPHASGVGVGPGTQPQASNVGSWGDGNVWQFIPAGHSPPHTCGEPLNPQAGGAVFVGLGGAVSVAVAVGGAVSVAVAGGGDGTSHGNVALPVTR